MQSIFRTTRPQAIPLLGRSVFRIDIIRGRHSCHRSAPYVQIGTSLARFSTTRHLLFNRRNETRTQNSTRSDEKVAREEYNSSWSEPSAWKRWIGYEQVPISKRWRFNCCSWIPLLSAWDTSKSRAFKCLSRISLVAWWDPTHKPGGLAPESDPTVMLARKVFQRLLTANELHDLVKWRLVVTNEPDEFEASVGLSGIFISTGVMSVCKDEDGLASVLAHEMAHVLAHHKAELLSKAALLLPLPDSLFLPSSIGLMFHLGKIQEKEADYIGMYLMAKAGYDVRKVHKVWQRHIDAEALKRKKLGMSADTDIPLWLSSHLRHITRRDYTRRWIPEIAKRTGWTEPAGKT